MPNGDFRAYALIASGLVAVAAIVVAVLRPEQTTNVFGFALTMVTILLAGAGLSAGQIQIVANQDQIRDQVAAVHEKVNGITSALVDSTAAASFQEGQAAGPGAPIPTPPSSKVPPPP